MYLIYIMTFNNFLLTRQRLKTALFSHFSSSCENQICFRCCPEPSPLFFVRSKDIRIANDANRQMFFIVFVDQDQSRFRFDQFLMPKV